MTFSTLRFTNEIGSEAAAATGIQIQLLSAIIGGDEPPVFTVDHPSLFAIVDNHHHNILFMGTLNNETD
uniref:Serpin domain-containing protein n=1 Tax=Panagrolaimus sp. ES5 TaxID=591445 RepID=A0AC34GP94_9BILA